MKTNKLFGGMILLFGIMLAGAVALGFTACGGDDDDGGTGHTHTYSTTWSYDTTQHWYACTANDGAKKDAANHTGDPCSVCGGRSSYELGDTGPGGGTIFYVSEGGFIMTDNNQLCHYLEVAPAEATEGYFSWASSLTYSNTNIATQEAIGTGRRNTALILAKDVDAPAAKACNDYSNNGQSDWFLPSKDELYQLSVNKASVGNLETEWTIAGYLSSSQYSAEWIGEPRYDFVWYLQSNGSGGNSDKYVGSRPVRAVRAF
jgi:hypothetical protein